MAIIDNALRTAASPLSLVRAAAPWFAVIVAALVSGALAAGKADAVLGEKPALVLLAALVAGAFLVLFMYLGSSAVADLAGSCNRWVPLAAPSEPRRPDIRSGLDRRIDRLHCIEPARRAPDSGDTPGLFRFALLRHSVRGTSDDDKRQHRRPSQESGWTRSCYQRSCSSRASGTAWPAPIGQGVSRAR